MKIIKGTILRVYHKRKGVFLGQAKRDFDTEIDVVEYEDYKKLEEKANRLEIDKRNLIEYLTGAIEYEKSCGLRTERFDIKNICDYLFEVIEICPINKLNERESHYINLYKDNPLNLNIMIPKDKEQLKLDMEVNS